MNVVDLLITIVVVTILVTIVLAVATYVAYKLRMAREPVDQPTPGATLYFVRHEPPAEPVSANESTTSGAVHASPA